MQIVIKPRWYMLKKWLCIGSCLLGIILLALYAVLIATESMPGWENIDNALESSKSQDIWNKGTDGIFHLLGIIGAATENPSTMVTFLVLTLLSKYVAFSEALANAYFWPYPIWSIIVSLFGAAFYRDLRKYRKLKKRITQKCPYCPHCSNAIGFIPAVQPLPPTEGSSSYPHQQRFDGGN